MDKRKSVALTLAVALAIPAEGLRQFAYYDPPGILTVCYGNTRDVEKGRKYTLEECRARLNEDMIAALDAVERCHPGLPENVLAAFGDAVYNLGTVIACDNRHSTASRMLSAGDILGACNQLPRWNNAKVFGVMVALPGLTTRRATERALCLEGVA